MKREPILTNGAVSAGITILLGLLVAFGLDLTEDQKLAILACAPVVAVAGNWLLARRQTVPYQDVTTYRDAAGNVVDGPYRPRHER